MVSQLPQGLLKPFPRRGAALLSIASNQSPGSPRPPHGLSCGSRVSVLAQAPDPFPGVRFARVRVGSWRGVGGYTPVWSPCLSVVFPQLPSSRRWRCVSPTPPFLHLFLARGVIGLPEPCWQIRMWCPATVAVWSRAHVPPHRLRSSPLYRPQYSLPWVTFVTPRVDALDDLK